MKRIAVIGFIALGLAIAPVTRAQYTNNFQTNIISGVTSNWAIYYYVGNTNFGDVLLIQNSGVLSNLGGNVGLEISASNNMAVVTGNGSAWLGGFHGVGRSGSGNSLIISNGGRVISSIYPNGIAGYVGYDAGTRSNRVVVTGAGSVWSNSTSDTDIPFAAIIIGNRGTDHSMTIADGGQVFDSGATIGNHTGSSNNSVLVTGSGSIWHHNNGTLDVGHLSAANNSLVISNGGKVVSDCYLCSPSGCSVYGGTNNTARIVDGGVWQSDGTLSFGGCVTGFGGNGLSNNLVVDGGSVRASYLGLCCGNLVQLDSGSIILTNVNTNAVLDVRGKIMLNGGTLQVDKLVITNACGLFVRTGGVLIYGTAVLTTNLDADGDGIPNGYEQSHGLDPLSAADANTDNDGDGESNLAEFLTGTDPTNSASAFRILSVVATNDDMLVTWATAGGRTNVVQSATDLTGSYTNVSPNIVITGAVETTTNYLDAGGATNNVAHFYRVRLVP